MSLLLSELESFVQEHRRCGDLDGGVEGERGLEAATSAGIERRTKSRNKPALSPAGVLTSSDLG